MGWNDRCTEWIATRPFIAGIVLFSFGAALSALLNILLGRDWSDWAVSTLIVMCLITGMSVWSTRAAHQSRG